MDLQRVLPDGACLFRSVACSFTYQALGYNLGPGVPEIAETTLRDVAANAVQRWLRHLTVLALCGGSMGDAVDVGTPVSVGEGEANSLLGVLLDVDREFRTHGIEFHASPAHMSAFHKQVRPPTTSSRLKCDPDRVLRSGISARDTVIEGPSQSFQQYCARMKHDTTWGGEPELYVLAVYVLRMPIHVVDRHGAPLLSYNESAKCAHSVTVRYNGINHYDAVLHLPEGVPPLFRL